MLFNSYEFIFIFLPLTLSIFFFLANKFSRAPIIWLIVASLIFYGYWDYRYVLLLTISILCNYFVGKKIFQSILNKKRWLILGIIFNLSLLFYFKYTGFFLSNLNEFFGQTFLIPEIILPLGISFFTFTQTAFLIDVYRNEVEQYSFPNYCLFVTIFPHLLAGPILYHKDIIPQFESQAFLKFNAKNFSEGLTFFAIGLFKKVAVADTLAPYANLAFSKIPELTFLDAWTGAIIYSMQLYFDFSGYSEMAIGLGRMLNLNLPQNFNCPYQSASIIDFWRRWHMTLSAFVKNYIYIPLGGNRRGEISKLKNLLLSMTLIGLWHGANWTFIIWGALHGFFLVVNHLWRRMKFSLPEIAGRFITFICVASVWVIFRASNVNEAFQFLGTMYNLPREFQFSVLQNDIWEILTELILISTVAFFGKSIPQLIKNFRPNLIWAAVISLLLVLSVLLMSNRISEFLYFQF